MYAYNLWVRYDTGYFRDEFVYFTPGLSQYFNVLQHDFWRADDLKLEISFYLGFSPSDFDKNSQSKSLITATRAIIKSACSRSNKRITVRY